MKKGVIFVSLLFLLLGYTFIAPFNNSNIVSADTYAQALQGINVTLIDVDRGYRQDYSAFNIYTYDIEFVLKTDYLGYFIGSFDFYYFDSSSTSIKHFFTCYVNGNSAHSSITITTANATSQNGPYLYNSNTSITSSNLVKYDDLTSDNVINLLQDINTNASNLLTYEISIDSVLKDIKNINTNIYNDLEIIKKIRQWNIPIESYGVIYNAIQGTGNYIEDTLNYHHFNYPIFKFNDTNFHDLFSFYNWQNINTRIIFISLNRNLYSSSQFLNYFDLYAFANGGFNLTTDNIKNYKILAMTSTYSIISFDVLLTDLSSQIAFRSKNINYVIPIYCSRIDYINVSTDFALLFGLSNELLDNLDIIANGTQQSNNSSSQADTTNHQAQNTFAQEEQLINNAENDLSNNLQSLDIANKNNNLFGNSKFIASAQWVKTQFDNLTNNNAFGYLITFSLVIGISLVIVGKLRG